VGSKGVALINSNSATDLRPEPVFACLRRWKNQDTSLTQDRKAVQTAHQTCFAPTDKHYENTPP